MSVAVTARRTSTRPSISTGPSIPSSKDTIRRKAGAGATWTRSCSISEMTPRRRTVPSRVTSRDENASPLRTGRRLGSSAAILEAEGGADGGVEDAVPDIAVEGNVVGDLPVDELPLHTGFRAGDEVV